MSTVDVIPQNQATPSGSSDWPASLAAQALRKAFLVELFGFEPAEEEDELKNQLRGLSEAQLQSLKAPLTSFRNAVMQPTEWSRVTKWIKHFGDEASLALWLNTLHQQAELLPGSDLESDTDNQDCSRRLLSLFSKLLGIAVMRPVVGNLYNDSSVYYAAIDHPFLNSREETKQLILDSVVVQPGRGSVARCLQTGQTRVSISFGDHQGVVEWQDLIQGQVSILMCRDNGRSERAEDVYFIVMAFFPVAYVFDDEYASQDSMPATDLQIDTKNDVDTKNNVFFKAMCRVLEDRLLVNTVAALTEYQDRWRRTKQFEKAIQEADKTETYSFATALVNLLLPANFADLPVPLNAAAAILADPDREHDGRLKVAHLRATAVALEEAIEAGAPGVIRQYLTSQPSGVGHRLAALLPRDQENTPQLISFQQPRREDLLFLPEENDDCEAIWWFHTARPRPWPGGMLEHARNIHLPLSAILLVAQRLVGWSEGAFGAADLKDIWQHSLPLFSEFKLRDSLAERYYSLVNRVLLCEQSKTEARLRELRFLLQICTECEALGVLGDEALVDQACNSVTRLKEVLFNEQERSDNSFLGATAFIRLRHRLVLTNASLPANSLALLPRLRIHQRLNSSPHASAILETGEKLELAYLSDGHFQVTLGEDNFDAHNRDQLVVVTNLHPERTQQWCDWIAEEISQRREEPLAIKQSLHSYLGSIFTPVRGSAFEEGDVLRAELQAAFQHSVAEDDSCFSKQPSIRSSYEDKLAPISNLFRVTMREFHISGRARADQQAANARAEMAEGIIGGTSHSIKIPIKVALKQATAENAQQIKEILEAANGFVTIGEYIQKRMREPERGHEPVVWLEVGSSTAIKDYLSITEADILNWLRLPAKYVSILKGEDRDFNNILKHVRIDWKMGCRVFCLAEYNRPLPRARTETSAFLSTFTEVVANAMAYSAPANPWINIEISEEDVDSMRWLVLAVENNTVNGQIRWPNRQAFDRDMGGHRAVVGIRMADWASNALVGRRLNFRHSEKDGQPLQRVEFRAELV